MILVLIGFILLILLWSRLRQQIYTHSNVTFNQVSPIQNINSNLSWKVTSPAIFTYFRLGKRGNTGNQMFEIATTLALARKFGSRVLFPTCLKKLALWKMFNLTALPLSDLENCPSVTLYEWDNFEDISIDPQESRIYNLTGYRQCPNYFDEIRPGLCQLFQPSSEDLKFISNQLSSHLDLTQPWISIHIRRGDAIQYLPINMLCPWTEGMAFLDFDYYKRALAYIRKVNHLSEETPVVICTDDPDWVNLRINEIDPFAILNPTINCLRISPKFADFLTLYLSPYTVIANSTFSWWASYLQANKFVVAPYPWFSPNGLIPSLLNISKFPIYSKDWHILNNHTGKILDPHYLSIESSQIHPGLVKLIRGYITS